MASLSGALPASPQRPAEAMVEHALRLLATTEVAEPAAAASARDRLAIWCERSDRHQAAHAEALRRWQALAGAAAGLRDQWTDPIAAAERDAPPASPSRRRLLGAALGGLAVAGLAGGNAWWQWRARQALFAQAWRTQTAQLMRVALPDAVPGTGAATEIVLSAQTALRAALYRDRREIELSQGEARFDVAADVARPLFVHTRSGHVEVVGTAFTVADRGGIVTVAVERGRVRFHPGPAASTSASAAGNGGSPDRSGQARHAPSATAIELGPGDAVSQRDGEAPGPVQRVATADIAAWRSGWLVFDDVPLVEALPAINAFRRAPLVLAGGPDGVSAGRLRLTARFQAADVRGLLAALPAVLPLRLEPRADGSVLVRALR